MKIKLDGLRKTIGSINRVGKRINKRLDVEVEKSAIRISNNAKSKLVPFGNEKGQLVSDINSVKASVGYSLQPDIHQATVFAGGTSKEDMAAYLEFGTGKYAQRYVPKLDPKYAAVAMSFYVNGKGTLKEHPFFIPAYEREKVKLSKRLVNLKVTW